MIGPGATIGILGGGQLGRMIALAAARLGYRSHVFTPETDSPCAQVSDAATIASFADKAALDAFAKRVDVVTLEFENVPVASVEHLSGQVAVHPGATALKICQDRGAEKRCAQDNGLETAPYALVDSVADLEAALDTIKGPAILKTCRDGYDGKGQVRIERAEQVAQAWAELGNRPAILEGLVAFRRELSVVVARVATGSTACFPLTVNHHESGILARSEAPAATTPELAERAHTAAATLADALDVIGLLAVELFETEDGRLLVNEMAPRPHNSGHWTIEGCRTNQFEQAVRAVCGLPLGSTDPIARVVMTNLIGHDVDQWPALIGEPDAYLHLYGKAETRPGRKMGHVTRILERLPS